MASPPSASAEPRLPTGYSNSRPRSSRLRAVARIAGFILLFLACLAPHLITKAARRRSPVPRRFLALAASIAGMRVKVVGENLASARSLEHSHRALWASPSHRDNMLYGDFRRMGVAVARAGDGTVWVTEVFVG